MGEITEALRRARNQRNPGREQGAQRTEPASPSAVTRAGFDTPVAAPQREPAPAAAPGSTAVAHDAVVVAISRIRTELWPDRAVLLEPREPHAERFRRFAVRVRDELERRQRHSVVVTSAQRAEGKTFTVCNLALALASLPVAGRIALLELDLRRPAAAAALGVTPQVGVEEVISGAAPLGAARMQTDLESLDLYLVRDPAPEAHRLLAHPCLARLLFDLEQRYDQIVIDSPPVLLVPDVSMIIGHVGGCIAVLRAGYTRVGTARDMLDQLPEEKLLGVFANDVTVPRNARAYAYYATEDEEK